MAFRTVVVNSRSKLEYSLNYLVCRKDNMINRVLLDEIKTVVINTLQVSITTNLISMLIEKKIKVLFVDEKHNPCGEIVPYQNNYYSYRRIREQIEFLEVNKKTLWTNIVEKKIENQALNLKALEKTNAFDKLMGYKKEIAFDDTSNREGHSAKVYFNSIFGNSFNRDLEIDINSFLNYGYAIILSAINREIRVLGYLTELGIHHIGESNSFNLSCDFIEPLRPLIDYYILSNELSIENYKEKLIALLSKEVLYNGKSIYLDNAIRLYVEDLFLYLKTGDESKIRFIEYGV